MKKRFSIFAFLLALVTIFNLGVVKANASGEYVFTTDGNSTVEGVKYTLTATRSLITCDVSAMNLDTQNLYVSVLYNFSADAEGFETKFDGIKADGSKDEGKTGASVVSASSTVGSPWNLKEQEVGDGYVLSTVQINEYTKDYASVSAITLRLKGVVGTTFDLYGFEITTDGNHSLDPSSIVGGGDSGSDDSGNEEAPFEPAVIRIDSSDSEQLSVQGHVVTLAAPQDSSIDSLEAGSYVTIPVSGVDFSNGLYASVVYKADGITGMGMHAKGGEKSGYVAQMISEGWNVNKETNGEFVILTAKIGSYLTGDYAFETFDGIMLKFAGDTGATFELYNVVFTTDGNHGIKLPEVHDPEDDGLTKVSGVSVPSGVATLAQNEKGEEVISYNTSPGFSKFDFTVKNYDVNLSVFEFKFTASEQVTLFYKFNGVENWDLGYKTYAGGKVSTQTLDVTKLNLPSTFTITLFIDASVEVTTEKSITIHSIGFVAPQPEPEGMWLGNPTGHSMDCVEGENGAWDISYSNDAPSWRNVTIDINKHEVEYDVIRVKVDLAKGTNLGIRLIYNDATGAEAYADIRNHHTPAGVAQVSGVHDLVFLVGAYGAKDLQLVRLELYFDPDTTYTTNTGAVTAKIVSYELLKSADLNLGELNFTVADATFDYTGEKVELNVQCDKEVEFIYEYSKVVAEGEEVQWATGTPKDAGEYNIRVKFAGSLEYNYKVVEAKVVINKVKGTVAADDVTVDAATRVVTVKKGIEASLDAEFAEGYEVENGDIVLYGSVIYYRHAGDKNHTASDVLSLTVEKPAEPTEEPTPEVTPTPETPAPNEPTQQEPSQPGAGEEPAEKGCGGSLVGALLSMVALCGAVVLRKKREE